MQSLFPRRWYEHHLPSFQQWKIKPNSYLDLNISKIYGARLEIAFCVKTGKIPSQPDALLVITYFIAPTDNPFLVLLLNCIER